MNDKSKPREKDWKDKIEQLKKIQQQVLDILDEIGLHKNLDEEKKCQMNKGLSFLRIYYFRLPRVH